MVWLKVKFRVYHEYGLVHEEVFNLDFLGIRMNDGEELSKSNLRLCNLIKPKLIEWTNKIYNHGDALPSWEIVEEEQNENI